MILRELKPKQALNKAFLKVKPNRIEIEGFKANLITLLDRTNDTETEEFHKNLVSDFLKDTYYKQNHFINTKGRNDLVIHNGSQANTPVAVIIEAKKPTNKSEMVTTERLNAKAFQELVLYYLRERITHKNLEVKHLVVTNINEWFIFDATLFDRLFAQNKSFVQRFQDFEDERLAEVKTDFFYKQIAEPYIADIKTEIEFTYFNLQDYQRPLRNEDKQDDNKLIALFKLLSPEHLLKLPFTNDSNSLDKRFYAELLHIIGLTETKEGGKKLIGRNNVGERYSGTILEDAIIQLDSLDKLSRLDKPSQYGSTTQERLFNVALELSITWINRILFLKLLEAQLITYHKGDKAYSFLNLDKIKSYDDLNSLFFQVLARKHEDRNEDVKKVFEKVPYLNSSLFEPTDMEQVTLFISNLKDTKSIPVIASTVLKDKQGKKRTGNMPVLEYLFAFLDAYDFSSEGSEEIQEDNKTLINASVLGLIFEKINGYKDGSFFTPGFITMYMCRETIRKAVVQKFNEALNTLTPGRNVKEGYSSNTLTPGRKVKEGDSPNTLTPGPSPLGRGVGDEPRIELQGQKINPELLEHAREMRKNETPAEDFMWNLLRNRRFLGYKFRRQHPVAQKYILDFFCDELRLGLELDGDYHNSQDQKEYDEGRTYELTELGIKIIRFSNQEVLWETEKVLETIRDFATTKSLSPLSLRRDEEGASPLSLGRGARGEGDKLDRGARGEGDYKGREARAEGLILKNFNDLYDFIGPGGVFSYQEANKIVNSIKICDPAVGSGHFLVSALNEMIAVKNDLKILLDRDGKRLKEYQVEVVNDELTVTDEEGELYEYKPNHKESQRIQETLFHEKQTIIENCLFGVDINTNSVKICRLRLWIELLKNAYYKNPTELETLPNIDINIKCGNSLVSRFAIDADLRQALKKSKWSIDSYRIAVDTYRNAENKEQKREMERLIADIKSDFRSEITKNDPKLKRKAQMAGELYNLTMQQGLFEESPKQKKERLAKVEKLEESLNKLETEIEEIKANKIFENAFEWRFEFPEVLNEEGDFVGFDVVIGNPPYMRVQEIQASQPFQKLYYESQYQNAKAAYDLANIFFELAVNISSFKSNNSYIFPHKFFNSASSEVFRSYLKQGQFIDEIAHFGANMIFEDADTYTCVAQFSKRPSNGFYFQRFPFKSNFKSLMLDKKGYTYITYEMIEKASQLYGSNQWILFDDSLGLKVFEKIYSNSKLFSDAFEGIFQGLATSKDDLYVVDCVEEENFNIKVPISGKEYQLERSLFKPFLMGKDVQRYSYLSTNKYVFFPYLVKKGAAEIVSLEDIMNDYPRTYEYIQDHHTVFKARENGKAGKMKNWHAYIYPKNLSKFEQPKLSSMEICASHPNVTLNHENLYHTTKAYSWVKKEDTKESYEYLLAIANSKLLWWFLKTTGDTLQGDARTFKTNYLNPFPLPAFVEPQIENEISEKVKIVMEKKKSNEKADTKAIENQIDQLVYKLYDLKEEEIRIVEGGEG
jgi:very-short-patch-repair endonuclease